MECQPRTAENEKGCILSEKKTKKILLNWQMNKGDKSDWLTLKTSVFTLFRVANLHYQLS